ncbi:MAG TPA: 1-acyl-sn-glycerol-3-phosphate acyltransferase [Anaerolineaceae bacterium]
MRSANQIEVLTRINLEDMLVSFGWQHWKAGRWLGSALFTRPARKFARQVIALDEGVHQSGLQEGARQILPRFVRGLKVYGLATIPTSGGLLVLSNHPGMVDTLALFASLPRTDLRVMGSERPFLTALPAISRLMIYVPEATENRLAVIRQVARALRAGESVLTFPAGHIEPDPAVLPGAVEALSDWSDSIGIFVRAAPNLSIVGAVVSHVLAPKATYHPLTRLRRQKKDRESLGATLQLIANTLFPWIWPVVPEITYTPPLSAASLAGLHDPRAITYAVKEYMRPFIEGAKHV